MRRRCDHPAPGARGTAAAASQEQQAAPAAAPAPSAGDDLMAQLTKLADMKNAGILSDAEFAAAKAKLLG